MVVFLLSTLACWGGEEEEERVLFSLDGDVLAKDQWTLNYMGSTAYKEEDLVAERVDDPDKVGRGKVLLLRLKQGHQLGSTHLPDDNFEGFKYFCFWMRNVQITPSELHDVDFQIELAELGKGKWFFNVKVPVQGWQLFAVPLELFQADNIRSWRRIDKLNIAFNQDCAFVIDHFVITKEPPSGATMLSLTGIKEAVVEPAGPVFQIRTWTNLKGQKITAKFVSRSADSVTIQREDGREFVVPLNTLSQEDYDYVKEVSGE